MGARKRRKGKAGRKGPRRVNLLRDEDAVGASGRAGRPGVDGPAGRRQGGRPATHLPLTSAERVDGWTLGGRRLGGS